MIRRGVDELRCRDRRCRSRRPRGGHPPQIVGPDLSVVIVEKGSAVGAHILSGAVVDPIGLDRLTPDGGQDPECPLKTRVASDQFYYLTETRG